VVGEGRRYARVLLEIAAGVERRGRRVAWEGVGVDGSGLLGRRIDRMLAASVSRKVSLMKQLIVAAVVAAAVVVAAACQKFVEPAPLAVNPAVAQFWADSDAYTARFRGALNLTPDAAHAKEQQLAANPNDRDTLEELLLYYTPTYDHPNPAGSVERVSRRRALILKLIDERPDDKIFSRGITTLSIDAGRPLADPAGYALARAAWLKQTSRPEAGVTTLLNAAAFMNLNDAPLAEQLLLRARAFDRAAASTALGELYCAVLAEAFGSRPCNIVPPKQQTDALHTFAESVRRTIDSTTDAALLVDTAVPLLTITRNQSNRPSDNPSRTQLHDLAMSFLNRAVALGGDNGHAQAVLDREQSEMRWRALAATIRDKDMQARVAWLDSVAPAERLDAAVVVASSAYKTWKDPKANGVDSAMLGQIAATLLTASSAGTGGAAADAAAAAHGLRGMIAMKAGDRKTAVREMTMISESPALTDAAQRQLSFSPANDLANYLLKYGERDTVAAFYDQQAIREPFDAKTYHDAATAVRAGVMPVRYQYYFGDGSRANPGRYPPFFASSRP